MDKQLIRFAWILLVVFLFPACQKQGAETTEETTEESVESVEAVKAVILQKVSEMDRALEVCKKRLDHCMAGNREAADTLRDINYTDKDWNIDDLTVEELEVFREMTIAELKGKYNSCLKQLEGCSGTADLEKGTPEGLPMN